MLLEGTMDFIIIIIIIIIIYCVSSVKHDQCLTHAGPLKMWPIGCPEMSVNIYKHMLRDNQKELRPQTSVLVFLFSYPQA